MANTVVLVGRMVNDCELKQTQSGTTFVKFTMAVPRKFKSKDGSVQADFPNCTAYGKTAELICQYIRKGHKFLAEGEIRTSQYQKDGQTIYSTDVNVNNVEFLEPKGGTSENSNSDSEDFRNDSFEEIDESIPF